MKIIFSICFVVLLNVTICFGQDHPIEIVKEQKGNIIILSAINSDQTSNYKVELNIVCTGFKLTKSVPVNETVLAGETKEMVQLIAKPGEAASLKYSYKMIKVSNITDGIIAHKRTETRFDEQKDLEEGIILFTESNCVACVSAKDFLTSKGKDFKEINIDANQSNKLLLWRKLEGLGYTDKTVLTPVVIVDGEMHYNIKDLKSFLEEL